MVVDLESIYSLKISLYVSTKTVMNLVRDDHNSVGRVNDICKHNFLMNLSSNY